MPLAVTTGADHPRAGFLGKLPARGDFVARGLRRGFADAWDAWLAEVVPGSRAVLGEDRWRAAFLEAPLWRFALPPGHCGEEAAAGVLLPSVDRAGRHWPLALAAAWPALRVAPAPRDAWFAALEAAGLAAVLEDAEPDRVAALLDGAPPAAAAAGGGTLAAWWTEAGGPRVAPRRFAADALPGPAAFAAMLDDSAAAPPG